MLLKLSIGDLAV